MSAAVLIASIENIDERIEVEVHRVERDKQIRYRVVARDTDANEMISVRFFKDADQAIAYAERFGVAAAGFNPDDVCEICGETWLDENGLEHARESSDHAFTLHVCDDECRSNGCKVRNGARS